MSDRPEISLNGEQLRAVSYGDGPLLIVAGPGTGKTRVVTERIRYLISEKDISPQSILALTFTEKAVEEMLARVDEVMPLGYEEPWLLTFHAFGDRILRLSGLEIGLDPDFKILTASEQWLFVREHLFDLDLHYFRPLGNPTKFISALLNLFSRAQDEDVSPAEFQDFVAQYELPAGDDVTGTSDHDKLDELARVYVKYQELKIANSCLDFGDLIAWTLKLFRDRPSVLQKYQDQFQYILVDEFQDTNYAQYQLIKLLAPATRRPNLLVVGDDAQAIYKFRGASLSNILNFKRDYPAAETIILHQDYRNPAVVISATTKLVKNNEPNTLESRLGVDKSLSAGGETKPQQTIELISTETATEEADAITQKILALVEKEKYDWRDFAILARANAHLDPFVMSLRRAGIPYQLLGNRGLFDQPEIRELIAFLRVVADTGDGPALFELLGSSVFGIDSAAVVDLLALARKTRRPSWEVIEENRGENEGLSSLVREVENARADVTKRPPTKILYDFVMNSGFVERFLREDSVENQLKIKNLNLFFERIKKFEADVSNPAVPEFVSYLDLLMAAGENPAQAEIEDIDTVNLLTVHSAKGLEWPVVFLVNLVAGRFPSQRRSDALELPDELVKDILPEGDAHLQEERRLFYVGCTRAAERLFLTWAKDYGGKRERRPSGFIEELGIDVKKVTSKNGPTVAAQLSLLGGINDPADNYQLPPFAKASGGGPARIATQSVAGGSTVSYHPDFVSYSQLEAFNQCPLKYKYRYVLGVPTLPSHTLSFGQTMHRVLRDFHRADLFGEKDLDYLLDLYHRHWIDEGYDSEAHKKERFATGETILKNYYQKHAAQLGKPLFLEKKFTLKIGETSLIGSIDRVDDLGDGVEVIDYKTGQPDDQKAVDKDAQLSIYALAARDALGLSAKSLALYFVENNQKVATTRSDADLDGKREELAATIEQIKQSDFAPTPNFLCDYCEYRHICPVYKIGG